MSGSKNQNVSKNYIYNLIYQIVAIIAPIITAPYLARVLTPDGVGTYQFLYSIVYLISIIIVLGTSSYAMREIAYHQSNKEEVTQLFVEVATLRLLIFIIGIIPYIVISLFSEYKVLLLIMSLYLFSVVFDLSWFYHGMERFAIVTIRNVVVRVFTIALIFIFVKSINDLWAYALIICGSAAVGSISEFFPLYRFIDLRLVKRINIKQHVKPSLVLLLPTIAISIYTLLDKILIGVLSTNDEVGFYSQVESLVKMCMTVITALSTALLPRIANLIAAGDEELVKKQIVQSCRFVFFLGLPMAMGMISISPIFIPLFLGPGYEKSIVVMQILPTIVLIIGFASVSGAAVMIPLKRQKQYTICVFSGAIVNLALDCALIPFFGSIGATIGTIFAELTVLILELFFIRDYLQISLIIKKTWKYFVAALLMSGVTIPEGLLLKPTILYNLILVFSGIIVYILVVLLLKDDYFFSFFSSIKEKLRRTKNN